MTWDTFHILILISLIFAVAAIVKPTWPLAAVAILLVSVALLVSR